MGRKLQFLLSTILCMFALLVGTVHAADPTLDSEEAAFLTLINKYRAQNGVGQLQVSAALQRSSEWMSADMANKNYFSHTDSLGRNPFTRMAAFNYPYSPAGENLAAGNADAQNTFNQWVNACDPDGTGTCTYAHRKNMLGANYKVIGIGRAYNGSARYRWYWTTDFGGYVDQTIGASNTTDTRPPTAPNITSAVARNATAVLLNWTKSIDDIGVAGYQILRNNTLLGRVPNMSFTDVKASPNTTYSYVVRAYDAAGNTNTSRSVLVRTPAAPTCYKSVLDVPAKCTNGTISQDVLLPNGCRSVTCRTNTTVLQIQACNKPGNYASEYFEMVRQTVAGATYPRICLGRTCLQYEGFVRSANFPVCI